MADGEQRSEEGKRITVDLCNFDDFGVMQTVSDLVSGTPPRHTVSYLERLVIEGDRVTRERLSDTTMEFPRVAEMSFGEKRRYYFGASWGDRPWISIPMRYGLETGEVQLAPLASHQFAGEPVPVPKNNSDLDSVWLLYTVLDTQKNQNQVFIADGDDIAAPPLAVLTLPQRIPFQLHGNWVPAV